MTLDIADPAIIGAVVTILGGVLCMLTGWLSKTIFDSIRERVDKIESAQHRCLEGLPHCFASKDQTDRKFDEHGRRLDAHGERIVRVEGKVGL